MKTDNLDSENKNTIGAFNASPSQEKESNAHTSEIKNDSSSDSSTIDSRLEKIAPVVSVKPSITIESVLPEHLQQFNKIAVSEEAHAIPLKSAEEKNSSPSKDFLQKESSVPFDTGTYHTISGGNETFKELNEKKASTVIESRPYSTIGIPNPVLGLPIVKKEKKKEIVEESSLFAFFFKIAVLALVLFLGIAFSAPHLLPVLVENGYLSLVSEGVYSTGEIMFTNTLTSQIPYLTSLLTAASFAVLLIALIIDLLVGKSIFLFAKVFIFIIIVLLLGVLIFYLEINGTDILGVTYKQFEVFR